MSEAAPQAAVGTADGLVCRTCGLAVVIANGNLDWGQPLHAGTMKELSPDKKHRAQPVEAALVRAGEAVRAGAGR